MLTVTPAQIRTSAPVAVHPVTAHPVDARHLAAAVATSYRATVLVVTESGPDLETPRSRVTLLTRDRSADVRPLLVDAVLDAYARSLASDEVLYVCVPDGGLSAAVGSMEREVSGLRHVPVHEAGGRTAATLATARELAEATLAARGPQVAAPLFRVATDASMRKHRSGAGLGVLAQDGQAVMDLLPQARTIAQGELAAIALAMRTVERDNIALASDSRWAVGITRRLLQARDLREESLVTSRLDGVAQQAALDIAELRHGRTVQVEWVKGHADDELNLGADRLAVLARRSADASCAHSTVREIATRIVSDHVGRTRGGRVAPELGRHLRQQLRAEADAGHGAARAAA